MDKRQIISITLGIIIAVVAMNVIAMIPVAKNLGGTVANVPTHKTAQTSSSIEVGPQENVRVVATTSRRSYLSLDNDGGADVYCNPNQDIAASMNNGVRIASSTSPYEFTSDKGNLYVGSMRCTANASTTITIIEFAD